MSGGAYDDDLAYIHDEGFGHVARAAAAVTVRELDAAGIRGGRVAELGCGTGISSRVLRDAGFDVSGVDLSPAMLAIARRRVPDADFREGSWRAFDGDDGRYVAVTAVGEVLGYLFDGANGPAEWSALFARVRRSLAPRGLFLFDMAGPERAPAAPTRTFVDGEDWAVLVEAERIEPATLVRRITSFRRAGSEFRRSREEHRLSLVGPDRIADLLGDAGFAVTTGAAYGTLELPPGLTAFFARPR